ncbi:hypothetical protein ACFL6X_07785 [Candidatus Latescibacterota bacterium]
MAASHAQSPRTIPHADSRAITVDGRATDWIRLGLPAILSSQDFVPFSDSEEMVTSGPPPQSGDLALTVWLAWSAADGRLYALAEIIDDSHVPVTARWDYMGDQFLVAIDADQSGGSFVGFEDPDASVDCEVLEEPWCGARLHNNRHAQLYGAYLVGAEALDLRLSDHKDWATHEPWAQAAVRSAGDTMTVEMAITPFDNLLPDRPFSYDGPQETIASDLTAGATVWLEVIVGDTDAPGEMPDWYSLSGSWLSELNGDTMPEFVLGSPQSTAACATRWGAVKEDVYRRQRGSAPVD